MPEASIAFTAKVCQPGESWYCAGELHDVYAAPSRLQTKVAGSSALSTSVTAFRVGYDTTTRVFGLVVSRRAEVPVGVGLGFGVGFGVGLGVGAAG